MLTAETYDPAFFNSITDGSARSAERIVPLVLSWLSLRSVVDVGCGDGSWLAEFNRHGVQTILGLDGGDIPDAQLKIPAACFRSCDLTQSVVEDRAVFDLAVSLEVAEHLPVGRAASLVADLTRLSPRVLFSAAIPFQRGTHHVNCRWPDYWQLLFERHAYIALDIIRPRIWDDEHVEFWYRQNTVLYVRRDVLDRDQALAPLAPTSRMTLERRVHPQLCHRWEEFSVRELLGLLPGAVRNALARRMKGPSRPDGTATQEQLITNQG